MDNSPLNLRSKINSTPKSQPRMSDGFSPVSLPVSPVARSPQSGNLTGNPRRVRDNVAEMYNLIQEWNSYQLNGVSLLTDVTNLKHSVSSETDSAKHSNLYPSGINSLIDSLNDICCKMDSIVSRMEAICKEFTSLSKLEHHLNTNSSPMFLTWPSEKFGESAELIFKSYSKELKLKYFVKENIAHCFKDSEVVFYSAIWLYQPYIDDNNDAVLEAMLKETGHR